MKLQNLMQAEPAKPRSSITMHKWLHTQQNSQLNHQSRAISFFPISTYRSFPIYDSRSFNTISYNINLNPLIFKQFLNTRQFWKLQTTMIIHHPKSFIIIPFIFANLHSLNIIPPHNYIGLLKATFPIQNHLLNQHSDAPFFKTIGVHNCIDIHMVNW